MTNFQMALKEWYLRGIKLSKEIMETENLIMKPMTLVKNQIQECGETSSSRGYKTYLTSINMTVKTNQENIFEV